MKGDAGDYALIYQVAKIFPEVKKMIHENIFQADGRTVQHYRVVTEKDRLAKIKPF